MQQGIQLSAAYELYIADCEAQGFTSHTLRFYRGRLSPFVEWCDKHQIIFLAELTHYHIRQYLAEMQARKLSSAYVHSHARALRSFLNFCVRDGLLDKSPFSAVKMPRLAKQVKRAIPTKDIQRVLRACESSERNQAIVLMFLDSGMRADELTTLNVGDVDAKNGSVIVRQGKGQKDRVTRIGAKTRRQVLRYLALERGEHGADDPLFVNERHGTRLTYSGISQLMKRLRKATGIAEFSAHGLRRTFAINMLRAGVDVYTLAKIMGHEDITVLRHYLELLEDDIEVAHNRGGPVDKIL